MREAVVGGWGKGDGPAGDEAPGEPKGQDGDAGSADAERDLGGTAIFLGVAASMNVTSATTSDSTSSGKIVAVVGGDTGGSEGSESLAIREGLRRVQRRKGSEQLNSPLS